MKRKLKINVLAGVVDIVMAFLIMISWFAVIFAAFGDATTGTHATGGVGTFFYICAAIALIIHVIALIRSRKSGISLVGHVLGIIGMGCFLITMFLALPAFVLAILAAIFSLLQKNVGDSTSIPK
ncbi:transporter [Sporolactobacillus sp. CQH2019]|uniref:transporter n=1 Tax=Sporolactobacillus sp. CQH2019 TaxID=3023512 RepID=UPI00236765D9|nr:transporter [Sporolactobacillus sp. CQH2019]MDD9149826.1 transporter [Sporolactobacillus sp. CQH2019]